MKKTILVTSLMFLLAATPAMAQMMGSGQDARSSQQMMEQQQMQQNAPTGGQNYPQHMNRGMTGGYGMGSGMMGGGYGMGPQMMGGYGMGPQMMGNYGYGKGAQMMSPEAEKQYKEYNKKTNLFLDETKGLRRELHSLKFEYHEALRSTTGPSEKLDKMRREMFDLHLKINNKSQKIK